jgi:hypothetical protein
MGLPAGLKVGLFASPVLPHNMNMNLNPIPYFVSVELA